MRVLKTRVNPYSTQGKTTASQGNLPVNQATGQVILPTGDRSRDIFAQLKANNPTKLVQPSFFRSEVVLKNGKAVYDFSVVKDTNSDSVTERKLDRTDKFVISHMGLFFAQRLDGRAGSEAMYPNTDNLVGSSVPKGLIEPDGNNIATMRPADCNAIYNGALSITVGQTKFFEGIDLFGFRAEASDIGYTEKKGMIELTPQILLDGSVKNSIQITAPITQDLLIEGRAIETHLTMGQWGTLTDIVLVLFCRGYLLTNK